MNSDWLLDSVLGEWLYWAILDGPAALGNHLWQSTLFAVVIGMLALLLRRNSARLRHLLWLGASLKFLLPFALLAVLGAQLAARPDAQLQPTAMPPVLATAGEFAAPMAPVADHWQVTLPSLGDTSQNMLLRYDSLYLVLAVAWLLGALFIAGRWLVRWRAIRRTLRAATTTTAVEFPVPVRVTTEAIEPGIVGILRPVLLLPAGIEAHLTPAQLRAVLAHELCHLRRRDNLTATLHMLVETLFWFHPLVWWLGARLIDERERACDEQVVREGHAPQSYAEAILRVCEHYLTSRLPCVPGVSGSDLRRRVQGIVANPFIAAIGRPKKLLLAMIASMAVVAPIAAGVVSWRSIEGRTSYRSAAAQYWLVLGAANDMDPALCTGPGTALPLRQARLAATVAGISPGDGEKALLFAVLANSPADAQRLLAAGATRSGDGFLLEDSLMHVAARFGDPALLQVLHDAGFEVEGLASSMGGGADASYASTPLMVAIRHGKTDNTEWLLQHGANVNAMNGAGQSALTLAMSGCKSQQLTTRLIQAGAEPDDRARRFAANLNFDLRASALPGVAPPPASTGTDYELAAQQAHEVRAASARGGTCPARSDEVWRAQIPLRSTVARLSVADGPQVLRFAILANSEPDVRRVLAAGAPRTDGGSPLLHAAAVFADVPVLQALTAAGLQVDDRDGGGATALMAATIDGRTDNVAWLLEQGANPDAGYTGDRVTPLVYALPCRSQMLVNLLLRAGAQRTPIIRQNAQTYGVDLPRGADALGRGTLDPPRGWDSPGPEVMRANPMRAGSPSLYTEARADIDGDGREDHAALFVAADRSREGLFVKLSSRRSGQWQLAASTDRDPGLDGLHMGIAIEAPGTYQAACTRGVGAPCAPGATTEVVLAQSAIAFFAFESARSLVYWDGVAGELRQVWTSD
jgi:beta-lactamase regulating signal transducer with metallopeptidase domain/ankyrin repeat protein